MNIENFKDIYNNIYEINNFNQVINKEGLIGIILINNLDSITLIENKRKITTYWYFIYHILNNYTIDNISHYKLNDILLEFNFSNDKIKYIINYLKNNLNELYLFLNNEYKNLNNSILSKSDINLLYKIDIILSNNLNRINSKIIWLEPEAYLNITSEIIPNDERMYGLLYDIKYKFNTISEKYIHNKIYNSIYLYPSNDIIKLREKEYINEKIIKSRQNIFLIEQKNECSKILMNENLNILKPLFTIYFIHNDNKYIINIPIEQLNFGIFIPIINGNYKDSINKKISIIINNENTHIHFIKFLYAQLNVSELNLDEKKSLLELGDYLCCNDLILLLSI